jgi:exopolyphosphatase/guanosine-5'-triphosphate,3'-diphosphate pyrophosphatase
MKPSSSSTVSSDSPGETGPGPTREVAVIDLGSNTARLAIFEATIEGGLRQIFEVKGVPRLGKGVGEDGSLSDEAMERGFATARRFAHHVGVMGGPPIVAVATSAVRDAPNGPAFVERMAKRTGVDFQIISGEEEARLGYLGVAASWELDRDLVADLGGGSLQLVGTREGKLEDATSLPLGALRLTQAHLEHDPPKRREIEDLHDSIRDRLRSVPSGILRGRRRVFGVGGTIRTLARTAMGLREYPLTRVHGYSLRKRDIEALNEILVEMEADRRREVAGVGGAHAEVILAGIAVLEELLRALDLEEIVVSGHGIREGVAVERLRISVPAPQEILTFRSVTAAARAIGFSLVHGEQIHRLALELFDLLESRQNWSASDRLALSVAAWMHDVGSVVDPWRHPSHSAYLIRNLSLLALTDREALLASLVAYLHEGDEVPEGWAKAWRAILTPSELDVARGLGALVALAESLEGARVPFSIPRGSDRLVAARPSANGGGPPSGALEKFRKPFKKLFGLELEVADE